MSAVKSTYSTKKATLTTADILAGFEEFGDDFMVIDIDALRPSKSGFAQYGDIYIKNANGELIHPRFWKISGQGLYTCSNIAKPADRKYESVRMGISHVDEQEEEIDNMKAMKILCEVFERKLKQFKDDGIITDDKKLQRKQKNGTMRPVYLLSTKIETPMLTDKEDKETGEYTERDHPVYYISIPKKRFYNAGETAKESIHFNNDFYTELKEGRQVPVMSFEYQSAFYNIDDFYHHPRSGKKIYKKLGDVDEETGETLFDNTNIQNYLTRNSVLGGALRFELIVVGRYAKLELSLYGSMYVHQGQQIQSEGVDDEVIDEFAERCSKMTVNVADPDLDEPMVEDF